MKNVFWLLLAAMLVACASENLYEGFKARETMRDHMATGPIAPSKLPSPHHYEAERRELTRAWQ